MKKKIFLTGGNSFIGKNLLESFLAEKYDITSPRSFELNLGDKAAVHEFFKNKYFDVVIHAAIKPGHRNAADLTGFMQTNLAMFANLASERNSFGKFLNIGSGAVYDVSRENRNVRENELRPPEGNNQTTLYKYELHKQIEKLDGFYDLSIFGIFGKYEDWEIRFISNAICKSLYGLPITLRQNRIFSYLWAEDLAPILEHFIENSPKEKFFNITPDEELSLLEAAKIVNEIAENKSEIIISASGMGISYSGNNSRLRAEMPKVKFTSAKEAIKKLYAWYKANIKKIDRNLLLRDK